MQNKHKVAVLFALLSACLVTVASVAAEDKKTDDKKPNDFVTLASNSGMAEVKLGKLAMDKAASEEVKNFGKKMIDDHSKANQELTLIVEKQSIKVSKEADKKAQEKYEELSKLQGEEFDRAYIAHMVKCHTEAVKLFEAQSKEGQDAELKAFAAKTLPKIQQHLEMAQKLSGQLKDKNK